MERCGKTLTKFYLVTVDCEMSIEETIILGKYDWVNPAITSKNFATKREGKAEFKVELIHFDHLISAEEALREIDLMGYRPAELPKLLALGCQYPDLQREFPIVALGSVWWGPYSRHLVPYLYGDFSERFLTLYWVEDNLGEGWRFETVRK